MRRKQKTKVVKVQVNDDKTRKRKERFDNFNKGIDEVFVEDKGIWKRFIKMLFKSHLPIIWIAVYIGISIAVTHIGVNLTEYTSEMMAGNFNFVGVMLPFFMWLAVNIIIIFISTAVSNLCSARIDRNLRRMVWNKVVYLPLKYYDKNNPKELITRISTDTSTISSMIIQVIIPACTNLYSLIVLFTKLGEYDANLALTLLLVAPFVLAVAFIVGKMQFGINDTVNDKNAEMTREVSEKVTNQNLVKSFATEEKEIVSGYNKMKSYYKASIKSSWIGNLSRPIYTIVGVLQVIAIILIGRTYYQNGSLTLPEWIAYFAFATQIANSLQSYAGYWSTFKASQGATKRVTYIMEELDEAKPKNTDGSNESAGQVPGEMNNENKQAIEMSGSFMFSGVSFSYGDNKVLDNVTLTIPEGQIFAFVGGSGSGKTTMMNLLERFYLPDEGKITIGGTDINDYDLKAYREQIAYVTQDATMLSGTIRQNLLYGIKREVSEEEIENACKAANCWEFIHQFSEGFDTDVGESGSRLSGGQKQRIAVARAILKNAKYLFLDEATAAMDMKATQEVWNAIENLMEGRTTVMIAHDWLSASHADYLAVIEKGKIVDVGTKADLLERNPFVKKLASGKEEE